MNIEISSTHIQLSNHLMFQNLTNIENIRIFMKYHVFAVWDFMSLLKSLQKKITCVEIPWIDSNYDPELVRLINEIVLGEESDLDQYGNPKSHFALYLQAMEEVGADTDLIKNFLKSYDMSLLPVELREILSFHLKLAMEGEAHQVAASFFYGREKLIPEMFETILRVLKASKVNCPSLIYYMERHIEVDAEDHGPKALKCLKGLIQNEKQEQEVLKTATNSLDMRWRLWDFINLQLA